MGRGKQTNKHTRTQKPHTPKKNTTTQAGASNLRPHDASYSCFKLIQLHLPEQSQDIESTEENHRLKRDPVLWDFDIKLRWKSPQLNSGEEIQAQTEAHRCTQSRIRWKLEDSRCRTLEYTAKALWKECLNIFLKQPDSTALFPKTLGAVHLLEHALGIGTSLQTLFVQKGAKQLGNSGV